MMYHLKFSLTGAAAATSPPTASPPTASPSVDVSGPTATSLFSASSAPTGTTCSSSCFNSSAMVYFPSNPNRVQMRELGCEIPHSRLSDLSNLVLRQMQKHLVDAPAQHQVHCLKVRGKQEHRDDHHDRRRLHFRPRRRVYLAHLLARFLQKLNEPLWTRGCPLHCALFVCLNYGGLRHGD